MNSVTEEDLAALVANIYASDLAFLTELGPLLLAGCAAGLASDTRGFARQFDVAHAHVLREAVHLSEDFGLLELEDKGEKSGRLFLSLTPEGIALTSPARVKL